MKMTSKQLRVREYDRVFSSLPAPRSARRSSEIRPREAEAAVRDMVTRAVKSGTGLPQRGLIEPTEWQPGASVFSNAGGLVIEREGGLRITRAAYLSNDFFTVVLRGEHVAMTADEAFDAGLAENAQWRCECSRDEAVSALCQMVARTAREAIS